MNVAARGKAARLSQPSCIAMMEERSISLLTPFRNEMLQELFHWLRRRGPFGKVLQLAARYSEGGATEWMILPCSSLVMMMRSYRGAGRGMVTSNGIDDSPMAPSKIGCRFVSTPCLYLVSYIFVL
jgi:hypothetical protein